MREFICVCQLFSFCVILLFSNEFRDAFAFIDVLQLLFVCMVLLVGVVRFCVWAIEWNQVIAGTGPGQLIRVSLIKVCALHRLMFCSCVC